MYLDRYRYRQDAWGELGINNIPPKHCTYSCLYCQVGPTKAAEMQPRAFYRLEAIFHAVEQYLEKLKGQKETVDYLTFVPDGEPTLDAGLARLSNYCAA